MIISAMQEETMNLKHLIVAVPQRFILGSGAAKAGEIIDG
jgi:hypothetical protein